MKSVTLREKGSTLTLTQSGLLGILLQYQRRKAMEMARRRAHREQLRSTFSSNLTWLWHALTVRKGGKI
jgi:hypothetical protein